MAAIRITPPGGVRFDEVPAARVSGQRVQGREGEATRGGPRASRPARAAGGGARGARGDTLLPVRPPGAGPRERPDRRPLSQVPHLDALLPELRALLPGRPYRAPPADRQSRAFTDC